MNTKKRIGLVTAAVMAPSVLLAGTLSVDANDEPPPAPIAVEVLTPRSRFTDRVNAKFRVKLSDSPTQVLDVGDPSRLVVARITVQPGAMFPWHIHPGPVIVNVTQGQLTYVGASDCVERNYPAETAFAERPNNVHTAYNSAEGETIIVATLFGAPPDGPLSITEGVEEPADCDIEVGVHSLH